MLCACNSGVYDRAQRREKAIKEGREENRKEES